MITINAEKCTGCGGCVELCPQIAIFMIDDVVTVDEDKCNECKMCVQLCPVKAPGEAA